ncbi:ankyrin repeat-containing domain protein [Infundibulicybe gibba]|nr:ankyrin repeat-containing domain protein [Infundibulicybe gibba]
MRGHDAIVQLLLASADLSTNWRSSEGITYLAMATRHKNEKAAKWLLAQGDMDANPKNSKGQGPIAMAADQDNDAIVKFFLDRDGIDINQARSGGKTPLDHATQQRRECVIELPHTAGGRMDVELKVESKGCRQESEQDKEDEKAGDDRRVKNVWEMKTLRRAERIGRKNKTRKQD